MKKTYVNSILYILLSIVLAFNVVFLFNQYAIVEGKRQRFIDLTYTPGNAVKVMDALKQNNIKGKVFCWAGYGGYILWTGYPDYRPFVDSRNVDLQKEYEYFLINSQPKAYWPKLDEKYNFDIVLIDSDSEFQRKLLGHLVDHPNWQFIMIDGSCMVFVKKGRFNLPTELESFERQLRKLDLKGLLTIPPVGRGRPFVSPLDRHYNNLLEEGVALYAVGYREAGLIRLGSAVQADPWPWIRYVYEVTLKDYLNRTAMPARLY